MTQVRIWDGATRLFHWLLVLLCICSFVTVQIDEMQWHERSGIAILVLILSRIAWGFVGSDTARFRHFLRGPASILAYVRNLGRDEQTTVIGHNPAGGAFVVLLLVLLLTQISLGLFSNDELYFEGPLAELVSRESSDTLTDWHHLMATLLLIAIGIHVLANVAYWLVLKQNLMRPMITGYRDIIDTHGRSELRWRGIAWWVLVLIFFIAIVEMTIGFR